MSVTLTYDLKGITSPITVHSEYSDPIVNTFWAEGLQVIQDVFEAPNVSAADVNALFGAITNLKLGAVAGIDTATGQPIPSGQGPTGEQAFLTYGMADSLDRLLKSLEAAGFDTVTPPVAGADTDDRIERLRLWQDLDDVGLREILVTMGEAVTSNRTLQALIELEYVKTGNDLIGDNLESLDEALRITRDALDTLARAQELKNRLEAAVREIGTDEGDIGHFDEPPGNDLDIYDQPRNYENSYEFAIEEAFGEPLGVSINFNEADLTEYSIVMNDLAQLRAQLLEIDPEAPLIEDLDVVLGNMRTTPDGQSPVDIPDVNLEYNEGDDVLELGEVGAGDDLIFDFSDPESDISGQREDTINAMAFWIYDGYAVSDQVDAGVFQRNLTRAITSAQNLNDTQKEDLRRFMYLFEQFYKSASAVLQAIDRMINKMAQNIKG